MVAAFVAIISSSVTYAQSSTETYSYDALGRLVKVETDGGSNDSVTSDIDYDDAGNRLNYQTSGAPQPPPPPPPPPSGDPRADLEADFVGRTNSGMWDLRAASNSGSFSAANIVNGLGALTEVQNDTLAAVDSVTGARVDGRGLRVAAVGDFMVYLLLRKDPDDEMGRIIYGNWPTRVRYWDGDPHVAGGVDIRFYDAGSFGAPVSNRDAMHDALDDDAFHAIKAGTFAFNASQDLLIGTRSGGMEGDVVAAIALDLSEVDDLAASEALIANWFESISPTAPPPPPPPPPPSGDPRADLEADFVGRTNSGMWDLRAASNSGSFSAANIVNGLGALTEVQNDTLAAVDSVTGARVDGRGLRVAAVGDFMVYLLLRKDPDDDMGRIIYGNWPTRVRYWDGDPHVAGGVDIRFYDAGSFGAPVSNRDAMHDALDDDAFHAIKAGTFAFNASQDLLIGTRSGGMEGDVVAAIALDLSEVDDLAASEALIANWFESISPN